MLLYRDTPWAKLTRFVDFHRTVALVLTIAMVLVAGGLVTAAYFLQPKPQVKVVQVGDATTVVTQNGTTKYYSPLTGVEVGDEATTHRTVTAVMIENSPDARPQSGIKAAGVVYEAIAEGGITRFLTLHQEDRPGLIGPVRSVRPYYVEWLAPFHASVAHVGGSQNALNMLHTGGFNDIDEFYNGNYYWRATDRVAPHNVYTNFDKLDALNQSKGYDKANPFVAWPRKLDAASAAPNAKSITIPISTGLYSVSYAYDAASNTYGRSEGGAVHKDREAGQITPKVVVAIKVPTQIGFEDGYREQMTTSGYNKAYIFQDGTVTEGFWRKADTRSPMYFYDSGGRPIALNPGQTWITALAPEKNITWQ